MEPTTIQGLILLLVILAFGLLGGALLGIKDRRREERERSRRYCLGPQRNEHGYPMRQGHREVLADWKDDLDKGRV